MIAERAIVRRYATGYVTDADNLRTSAPEDW
jgi:hypothetical protein